MVGVAVGAGGTVVGVDVAAGDRTTPGGAVASDRTTSSYEGKLSMSPMP